MLNKYAEFTDSTAIYPGAGSGKIDEMAYLSLGLSGEVGELSEIHKKILRDRSDIDWSDKVVDNVDNEQYEHIVGELGDIAWYWVRLCAFWGITPEDVIEANRLKLESRKQRGKLSGSGNNR